MATYSEMKAFALKLIENRKFRDKFFNNPEKVATDMGIEFTNDQLYDLIRIILNNAGFFKNLELYNLFYINKNTAVLRLTDRQKMDLIRTLEDKKPKGFELTNNQLWELLRIIIFEITKPQSHSSGGQDGHFVDFW